jgi:hypothetical protein
MGHHGGLVITTSFDGVSCSSMKISLSIPICSFSIFHMLEHELLLLTLLLGCGGLRVPFAYHMMGLPFQREPR